MGSELATVKIILSATFNKGHIHRLPKGWKHLTDMRTALAICGDLDSLLSEAPNAVDSFFPGHWKLMAELERRATEVVARQELETAIAFLVDVAFLKQPHRLDRNRLHESLRKYPNEIVSALAALREVDRLDYRAMHVLAAVPWFGRSGGRAFNSAVFRLARPDLFGIIDWRNLAVITGAPGFQGLIVPPLRFEELPISDLPLKGHLTFRQETYEKYNDALRALGLRHGKTVAEIDLILWTYSIRKSPFTPPERRRFIGHFAMTATDRDLLRRDHQHVAARLVDAYLETLKDLGYLSRERAAEELCSVFALIRDECKAFGSNKMGKVRDKVNQVVQALENAIVSRDRERLLSQWTGWYAMVDPASASWIGIKLPTDMVLEGYLVFEDFLPIKRYFEEFYDSDTLEPRTLPH